MSACGVGAFSVCCVGGGVGVIWPALSDGGTVGPFSVGADWDSGRSWVGSTTGVEAVGGA